MAQIGQCEGPRTGRHENLSTKRCGSETLSDTLSDVEAEALIDSVANAVAGVEFETIGEILSVVEANAQFSTLPDTQEETSV